MDARVRNNIIKANIELLDENKALKEDKEILKRRIDKAIEYIDRRDIEWGSEEHNKLLNILKGEYIYE